MLQIIIQDRSDIRYIHVNGQLDISTSEDFAERVSVPDQASEVVLDFTKLTFIDSTGIGAILEFIYQLKENNRKMNIIGLNEEMKDVFETIGVLRVLDALQRGGSKSIN
jgi:anti-anti-sigma factor